MLQNYRVIDALGMAFTTPPRVWAFVVPAVRQTKKLYITGNTKFSAASQLTDDVQWRRIEEVLV